MRPLLETAMEGVLMKARIVLEEAEKQHAQRLTEVTEERVRGLAEVAGERAKGLAEIDERWAELHREIVAMQSQREAQQGRIELNIGGYRFETSVQTLVACRILSLTPISAVGTRRTSARTAAFSLIGTASTSAMSFSTCAMVRWRWRSPAHIPLCR